ncbi:methyltransferase type 11 [Nitrincola sp. A-D6]|uniref:class I SAM-dependent methyltransferase n=1 Tax=Nitrincola sp. A-D6 TaxID=1545442 RepID=UPI00051FBA48|nr:class I SAM-dependent methyltransferase [Nitrincola sp. A-D6]KGK41841.1 methyltransferase type 11 [Nitrincola sp. A-D6]
MKSIKELKNLYKAGINISEYLKNIQKKQENTTEIIEIAYDIQTGSYIKSMEDSTYRNLKKEYVKILSDTINNLYKPKTIMEAGVGEATTLAELINDSNIKYYGFDLSWSRIKYAKDYLEKMNKNNIKLCTANLNSIPFLDNSIDIVYTSHSIEPNRGSEKIIIQELYRVARKYLILLEPAYDLSNANAKERMNKHGYCRNIKETCYELGYNVIKHELFPISTNPLNPTGITIIEKNSDINNSAEIFACPIYKTPLEKIEGNYYSEDALSVYPSLLGIPCLRIENKIIASKYKEL